MAMGNENSLFDFVAEDKSQFSEWTDGFVFVFIFIFYFFFKKIKFKL
jgi:hypothetical protein